MNTNKEQIATPHDDEQYEALEAELLNGLTRAHFKNHASNLKTWLDRQVQQLNSADIKERVQALIALRYGFAGFDEGIAQLGQTINAKPTQETTREH